MTISLVLKSFVIALLLVITVPGSAQQQVPNPVIQILRVELYEENGKKLVKYHFGVDNRAAFPAELFAEAPDLPPCGKNTKASRTWLDIYTQDGKRLNGFCALSKPADLGDVWFALSEEVLPPSWIYIELTDRKTNTKYKSNLSETSQ